MTLDQQRRRLGSKSRDSWIAIGGVPYQSEIVWDSRRWDTELGQDGLRVANGTALPIDLHDALPYDALRKILVRGPDADLLDPRVLRGQVSRRRERVVGLELHHGPHDDSHRLQRLLERMELREERAVDTLPGLVV